MSNEENQNQDEPKIIVDSDWKEQVEKEKAAAMKQEGTAESSGTVSSDTGASDAMSSDSGSSDPDTQSLGEGELPPPPPASFEVLISMLFSQALSMLGQIPDPSGKTQVNKPYAKHTIDTLEMLGEKTKDNLNDDEQKILSEALHALRMAYVSVKA